MGPTCRVEFPALSFRSAYVTPASHMPKFPLRRAYRRIPLTWCVLAVAFLAPATLAQTTPTWGVYLCQLATVDVGNDPSALVFQGQYPPVSPTNPAMSCNTTTIQTTMITNPMTSSLNGQGPGYSDDGNISATGTAMLGTLSATMNAFAVANGNDATSFAQQSLGWVDTFTITQSSTIPNGTLVPLNITVTSSGKITPPVSGSTDVYMQFLPGGGASPVPLLITAPGLNFVNVGIDGTSTYTATLKVRVGDTFQLGARMNTQVLAAVGGFLTSDATIAGADSIVSSSPTFNFTVNIDPGVPCVSYKTASGTPYFSSGTPASCGGAPPTCAQIVKGAVQTSLGWGEGPMQGLPIVIGAAFTPNFGLTLAEAATGCSFDHFDFQQVVTGYFGQLPAVCPSGNPTVPTLDPPSGGWQYTGCDNAFPFVYDQQDLASGTVDSWCPLNPSSPYQTENTLTFCDNPVNPSITSGHVDSFWTALVGVTSSGKPVGAPYPGTSTLTPLWAMTWTDSFNGALEGGIIGPFLSGVSTPASPDSTSGTGGVVILNSGAPVPGDVNGDGVVNCADLDIVKAAFGKTRSQAGFDARADVNFDGVVNILDLSVVAKQLPAGTVCQ